MREYRQGATRIAASDVVSLLREVYRDGVHRREDAEALIAFDRDFSDPTAEWCAFAAHAIADHVLYRAAPAGILDEAKAAWLMQVLAPSGCCGMTRSGTEALRLIAGQTGAMPASFAAFAIRALWMPAAASHAQFAVALAARDVTLLNRILKSAAGRADAPVSLVEAEALFDLHDAVAAKKSHASFDALFFRAITNHVLGECGREKQPRSKALARDPRRDAGHGISTEARAWLYTRIMRDGRPTAAERLLLTLAEQARSLHVGFERRAA
ncbi:MAG TPA: hypothetical protein PL193_16020 [Xanthobacteraceae bacterium]|nr:hypothetical protein [Xanthobacteraceae bacterium]